MAGDYVPPTKLEQLAHWLEQIEFQHGALHQAFHREDYNYVRRGLETMLSMLMFSAVPDAKAVEEEAQT